MSHDQQEEIDVGIKLWDSHTRLCEKISYLVSGVACQQRARVGLTESKTKRSWNLLVCGVDGWLPFCLVKIVLVVTRRLGCADVWYHFTEKAQTHHYYCIYNKNCLWYRRTELLQHAIDFVMLALLCATVASLSVLEISLSALELLWFQLRLSCKINQVSWAKDRVTIIIQWGLGRDWCTFRLG